MNLWLDDLRRIPTGYDIWCRTAKQAIWALQNYPITHISFDNDLGDGFGEGADVARWIEEQAFYGKIEPMTWNVHTANCVRGPYIEAAMKNADKFWRFKRNKPKHNWEA